MKIFSINIPK